MKCSHAHSDSQQQGNTVGAGSFTDVPFLLLQAGRNNSGSVRQLMDFEPDMTLVSKPKIAKILQQIVRQAHNFQNSIRKRRMPSEPGSEPPQSVCR